MNGLHLARNPYGDMEIKLEKKKDKKFLPARRYALRR